MKTQLHKPFGLAAAILLGFMPLNVDAAVPCSDSPLKKEAECADYQGTLVSLEGQSGSGCVSMNESSDYINFTFNVESLGLYKVYIAVNGAYGQKTFNCIVNGASNSVTGGSATEEVEVGSFKLVAGDNSISITPAWTWVPVDYVRIEADNAEAVPFTLANAPVTANATESAKALYAFMVQNFGSKTISGAMLGDMDHTDGADVTAHEDVSIVKTLSGKNPALIGVDFMNATGKSAYSGNTWYSNYTSVSMSLMKDLWAKGGIPKFTWHWRDPSLTTDAFYVYDASNHPDGTNFDFTEAMNEDGSWNTSSEIYQNMIKDIDVIADYFLELKAKGVAGIFRPLHEASGAWFWWGSQGGENYAKLYRLVYDEMVKVKGVDNLLWVWNPNSVADAGWNPGEEYYDIVSVDIYTYDNNGPVYHVYDSQSSAFSKLKNLTNSKKMVALTECGSVPDVELCYDEYVPAKWSWWMPWYESWSGNWVSKGTEQEMWTKVMNDERIITLEDMPGWNSSSTAKVANIADAEVYPTKVSNYFIVDAKNANVVVADAAGRIVANKVVDGMSTITTADWNNGVYFVTVTSANGVKTYKLVK